MITRMAACPVLLCWLLVPAFSQTNGKVQKETTSDSAGLFAGPLTVETLEAFSVADGGSNLDCTVLNSTTTCNGQGPGLVVAGVDFIFSSGGQWNGAHYFGSPSKEISSNGRPLTIDFSTPVTIFGLDLRAYAGYSATATVTIYGLDDTTIIGTLSPVYLSGTGGPIRVGWQDDAGIGKIVLTQTGQSWSRSSTTWNSRRRPRS